MLYSSLAPHRFATPWPPRIDEKITDAVNEMLPKALRLIASELGRSAKSTNPLINLSHTTPAGMLALHDNDQRFSHTKASKALENGTPVPGLSATPILDAARRLVPGLWDANKLAEYSLAAVDYTLMLASLVNPAFVVPNLVMLHHVMSIANGEHPTDWPHMVRFLELCATKRTLIIMFRFLGVYNHTGTVTREISMV